MKVKMCENCANYTRKRNIVRHKPVNYHTVGFTYYFGWCKKHNKRCSEVRKCGEYT